MGWIDYDKWKLTVPPENKDPYEIRCKICREIFETDYFNFGEYICDYCLTQKESNNDNNTIISNDEILG